MQKIILFSFFMLAPFSIASDLPNIVDDLESLNKMTGLKISEECDDTNLTVDENYSNPFRECVEEICGKARDYDNYQEIYDRIANDKTELKDGDILDGAEEYYQKKVKYQLEVFKRLRENLKEGNLSIDDDLKRAQALRLVLSKAGLIEYNYRNMEIDDSKFTAKLYLQREISYKQLSKYIKPDIVEGLMDAMEEMDHSNEMKTMFYSIFYGWPVVLLSKNPGKKLDEIVKEEARKSLRLTEEIEKKEKVAFAKISSFVDAEDKEKFHSILKEDYPSESILKDFFLSATVVKILKRILVDEAGIEKLKDIERDDYSKMYNIPAVQKRLDEIIFTLEKIKKERGSELIESDISECKAIISNNRAALPSKEEKAAFMKNIDEVRENIKNNFIPEFSESTSNNLKTFIDGVYVELPESKEQMEKLIKERINNIYRNLDSDLKYLEDKIKNKTERQLVLYSINEISTWDIEDFTDDLSGVCDDYELEGFKDAVYNIGIGKIKVSWISVRKGDVGKDVLTHEFGHAIGSYFENNVASRQSFDKYKETRLCLNDMQRTMKSNRKEVRMFYDNTGVHGGEYHVCQYTEEDWADLISARLMDTNSPNSECFFLGQESEQYIDYDIFREEEDEDVRHSPSLFRLLHMEFIKKGALPASCDAAIKAEETGLNLKKCGF